jgi:broad specificity phosphatase PhoE
MKQAVWITRHGNRQDFVNPDWGKTARWKDDPGLSEDGVIQAQKLAERLRRENISQIFTSPFLRAIETASQVAKVLGLKIKVEAGLSEWMNANWFDPAPVLMPLSDKAALFPEIDLSYNSRVIPVCPETWEEMEARVAKTVGIITSEFSEDILLVGHGASVEASMYYLTGKSWKRKTHYAAS